MASRIQMLKQKISQTENLIGTLRKQLSILNAHSSNQDLGQEEKALRTENDALKKRVQELMNHLVSLETANGLDQIPMPCNGQPAAVQQETPKAPSPSRSDAPAQKQVKTEEKKEMPANPKQAKKSEKKEAAKPAKKGGDTAGGDQIDVSRLDMRIGEIVDVKYHPDADTLYVETVNIGEEKPRTILSGLVKSVPINEMQGRRAVFLCNLKPVKMRGIFSEGMIMCASKPEAIEIIKVPDTAVPGDLVSVEGYPRTPDAQLNPKKKIFEKLKPDLLIDAKGFATFKSAKWVIEGKGYLKAPTLTNAQIS